MDAKRQVAVVVERTNGYARELIRGIADFAGSHPEIDFRLFDPERFHLNRRAPADGYVCRVTSDAVARRLMRHGKPVVDLLCLRRRPGFAAVRPDVRALVGLAVAHFAERRFTRFAFCGFDTIHYSDIRRDAFADALRERGQAPEVYRTSAAVRRRFSVRYQTTGSIDAPPDIRELEAWLKALPKPIAVFCCDDFRAHQVANLCRTHGITVPNDVAVLGVDDDPVICTFSSPRLSSVDPNAFGIGRAAAESVIALMDGRAVADVTYVPPKGIAVRESSECYPLDPPWMSDALVFIRRQAANGISAADVFARLGLSHTTVQRAFRDVLKSSVQKEIIAARLDEARRLLVETDLSAVEVARRSGFAGVCYFTHAFTGAEKLSPLAYRQRHRRR